jgi:DNA-directed RNA polymerase subunit RPC12/RpoP
MKGSQKKFTCPKCGKPFTAWRPDELPGVPVKCYFCGNQFEDEAAKRKPATPPAPPPAAAAPAPAPDSVAAAEPKAN